MACALPGDKGTRKRGWGNKSAEKKGHRWCVNWTFLLSFFLSFSLQYQTGAGDAVLFLIFFRLWSFISLKREEGGRFRQAVLIEAAHSFLYSHTHFVCQQNTDDQHYITSRFCPPPLSLSAIRTVPAGPPQFCILDCIIIVASILSFPPRASPWTQLISSFPSFLSFVVVVVVFVFVLCLIHKRTLSNDWFNKDQEATLFIFIRSLTKELFLLPFIFCVPLQYFHIKNKKQARG